ncbi:prion-like-(Q/N-rich) domain-bearing protein 25 [Microplitis mediator]|uniref:prion-like-(Q/N-rich) domain-bearing protein 25 n=1 Tax=Microplitis mediator TaxID=375433 RepID=UPI002557BB6E|nr:prion-like-(Q/N-rich) domain-bearing protein 25 [Microplitis mediator]
MIETVDVKMTVHILLSVSCGILAFLALFANPILGDGESRIIACGNDRSLCNPLDLKPCCNNNMQCKENSTVGYFVCTEKEILGLPCVDDLDCEQVKHSNCNENKVCGCTSNTIVLTPTLCAPIIDGFCLTNESCIPDDSICIENKCKCKLHLKPSLSKTDCEPTILKGTCETNTDCNEIEFSICSNNQRCVCGDKYVQATKTTCLPILNGTCFTDIECTVDNSICINNKCSCKPEFASISDKQCNPVELGLPCYDNLDCAQIYNSVCSNDKKCVCRINYVEINKKICAALIDEYCSKSIPCAVNNSNCIENTCQCGNNFLRESNDQCLESIINQYCHENLDCEMIQNTVCSKDKVCVCEANYIQVSYTRCAPLLYEFCEENDDCATTNSICSSHQCTCDIHYSRRSNDQCLPSHLGGQCTEDIDCDLVKNSECSSDKKCICKENYIELNKTMCASPNGYSCLTDEECGIKNSVCIDNECQCRSGYITVSNIACILVQAKKYCDSDDNCTSITNSQCSQNRRCVCKENYVEVDSTHCATLLFNDCLKNEDCVTDNSICSENKCQCGPYYTPESDNKCLPNLAMSC